MGWFRRSKAKKKHDLKSVPDYDSDSDFDGPFNSEPPAQFPSFNPVPPSFNQDLSHRPPFTQWTLASAPQPYTPYHDTPYPHGPAHHDRTWQSYTNLAVSMNNPVVIINNGPNDWQQNPDNLEPSLQNLISSKFNAVISSIDANKFSGDERELFVYPPPPVLDAHDHHRPRTRGVLADAPNSTSSAPKATNHFSKVNLYANSRLPDDLPPLNLHLRSYKLFCLAADYSQRIYDKPRGTEYVAGDWRTGTKSMIIKTVEGRVDKEKIIVFAIQGTQTIMDWAVNFNTEPASPSGFLDDEGNLCHSGFLACARRMAQVVAARIKELLAEKPSRARSSLLITGHSAGGAIACLLYAHMFAENVQSELNTLAKRFKNIHCITFGAPPLSLLPLAKPRTHRWRKSHFYSIINEGDPVVRAEPAYVRSLLQLFASPAPIRPCIPAPRVSSNNQWVRRRGKHARFANSSQPQLTSSDDGMVNSRPLRTRTNSNPPIWRVPPSTLCNAGSLVLLRAYKDEKNIRAFHTTDQQLRGVVFGDPVRHMMKWYIKRVKVLATKAMTSEN
ncbi:MAG: hypothetical protein M1834_002135 [Cirrosporium novae-zelandiae]|nr:MAG: hypothetical protein M1834_002135 [Cirrosporium novae-zelandiae]